MSINPAKVVSFQEDLYTGPRHDLKHSGSQQKLNHKKSSSKLFSDMKKPPTPGISAFQTNPLPYPSPVNPSVTLPVPGIKSVAKQGYTLQPQASPVMGIPQMAPTPQFLGNTGIADFDGKKHHHKKQASSIQIPIQVASPYMSQPSPAIQLQQQHHYQQPLSQPYPMVFHSNGISMEIPTPFSTAPPMYSQQPPNHAILHPHIMQQQQNPNFLNTNGLPYYQPVPSMASQLAQLNQKVIDITNQRTKKKSGKPPQQLPPGYKFNPDAFATSFDNARLLNCLQIVTHQLNEKAEINEYLLLRPFANDYVSETGTRITVEYDEKKEQYVTVATDKIDPTEKDDYVGVRTVGVITNDDLFYTILEFIPLPLNGGRETRPKKGERPVPLETFRGWSSLVIMEARKRKVLSMLD